MRGSFMASMAISGINSSNATQSLPTVKTTSAQTETTEKAPAVLKPDTVKLSTAAQAKMMHRAGQSPALIAASLGTNVAAVDGYLNIKVAAQAAATPTQAPVAQSQPAEQTAPAEQATPTAQSAPEMSGKN
jgi:hypothetical protein